MSEVFSLKSGLKLPGIGFGTWKMGERAEIRQTEKSALLRAMDLGFTLFDTAEMYGEGRTETLLGEALAEHGRDDLILVSKVYPWNAGSSDMIAACEASLTRLGTDMIDIYLLHWPGSVPFEETLEAAERLKAAGKIRTFGISNFDTSALEEMESQGLLATVELNQVMYNPARRGIEYDLLPALSRLGISAMAYTPLEPARLSGNAGFAELAAEVGLTPPQLALAWHVTRGAAIPIPKAGSPDHADALWQASQHRLSAEDMARIDAAFPPPSGPQPLDIL
ncbi:aldo/keto reductase [Algicella marina]|uniref:Aldo/keto reductase n=1 Tax=Algicella marina TaxID=2683284 RepID=A0A6P1T4Q4_9RHOB|nr:aldo/keto reductase [Algicella marina]QHQ36249.1 aldo/keto reductase [Algicella marina]